MKTETTNATVQHKLTSAGLKGQRRGEWKEWVVRFGDLVVPHVPGFWPAQKRCNAKRGGAFVASTRANRLTRKQDRKRQRNLA